MSTPVKTRGGWQSVFRGKDRACRIQGIMTRVGMRAFETHRKELAKLAGVPVKKVGDSDVTEYLSRGKDETVKYLAALKAELK